MSRAVLPLAATWRGVPVPLTRIEDSVSRTFVSRLYPGQDRADFEDVGAAPDSFNCEAHFFGSDWKEGLELFLTAVRNFGEAGNFVHPFWGTVRGVIQDVRVQHADTQPDSARVTFSFTAGETGLVTFRTTETLEGASAATTAALASATSALAGLPE